jgi:hypothetical protein
MLMLASAYKILLRLHDPGAYYQALLHRSGDRANIERSIAALFS